MTDVFELRHRPTRNAVTRLRVWPLVLAVLLLGVAAAGVVALATQDDIGSREDLGSSKLITAWFVVVGGSACAGLVLHRAWRTWPAASRSLVVIRLDPTGPWLRKGRFRDDTWYHVPWSAIEAVTFTPLPLADDADEGLRRLRLLRFVPAPEAHIPEGPPGALDHVLGLPPREAVLTFVAGASWDDDVRGLLDWVRRHQPELRAEDAVPR